ncbi:MAG TPA: hypothetical protein GX399_05455 [Xanthomonadaceae bacterium]|nr:hypothetical protein [Xanthomonadaceae bacterium]
MNKTLAAASFALITALSGLSTAYAAGFNDRGPAIDTTPARTGRQDLSQIPVVHGFNQRSHHAEAALASSPHASRAPAVAGVHCDLAPRLGFNDSTSFAIC